MTNLATKQDAARPDISLCDLDVMMATAAAHSRKLARSLKLSQTEREDAEQDILLMLLERWHYFDDSRGSNIGFAIRIARQAVQLIADRIAAGWQAELVSLEQPAPWQDRGTDDASWISEQIGDETLPDETALVSALSLRSFTTALPEDLAIVVDAVFAADGDIPAACGNLVALLQRIPSPPPRAPLPAGLPRTRAPGLAQPPVTSWEETAAPTLL